MTKVDFLRHFWSTLKSTAQQNFYLGTFVRWESMDTHVWNFYDFATVFGNHRKSLIQHCEWSWKAEACSQTVFPDRPLSIKRKMVEIPIDILSDFQTLWNIATWFLSLKNNLSGNTVWPQARIRNWSLYWPITCCFAAQNIMFGYKYKTKTKDYLTYGVLLLFDGLFEHGLHNWVFISLTFVRRLKRCLMP